MLDRTKYADYFDQMADPWEYYYIGYRHALIVVLWANIKIAQLSPAEAKREQK